ncbi:thioredoxin-disulfide reductase [Thermoproteota archaeon]
MYDIVIVGAGPAGLTAALYCGRSKLRTKVLDEGQSGGQLNLTEEVDNFPGVFKSRSKDLVETMVKQVKDFEGVELDEFKKVLSIEHTKDAVKLVVQLTIDEKKLELEAKALIVASGAHPKRLGVVGEEGLIGKGVSYCAVCDAPFFRDKDVVLIGGGNTAIEEALYLAKFTRSVKVIHRRDQLRAVGIVEERARSNPKIEFVLDSVVEEICGGQRVEGVKAKNVKSGEVSEIKCSGVFIFVGYTPNTEFLGDSINLDGDKFIITDDTMATNKKGIFACGDCRKRPFKQVITACGEGAVAAHAAEKHIEK